MVGEISFEAEYFTTYTVVSDNKQLKSVTIAVGGKLTLYNEGSRNRPLDAGWSVTSGSDVVKFVSGNARNRSGIEIVGLVPGTATVKVDSGYWQEYSYTIIVASSSGINAEYWITNQEVTGSDGRQLKNISSADLDQYGDGGVSVGEMAPATGNRGNDGLIFWHARVLLANNHQTNGAGVSRVNDG